ncbi:MAG: IS3 family transposase, partial [Chloroflexi bacterium]|nr:IS3 family transposase [Chloroflexota bacterium]
ALPGKLLSPAKRRRAVAAMREQFAVSERRACAVVGQARATERYVPRESADEQALRARIVALATRFGRYGYRRITALLHREGWRVNHKRVERLWRQEGLRVAAKQPKRGRLWLADGSIVRLQAEHPNHVWAYDFVFDRTADGRKLRMLTVVDEYTRECLAIEVGRRLSSQEVLAVLADLCVRRGPPAYIRSDNGPEFVARAVRQWLGRIGVQTLFIEPGSPWENGYIESFNGRLRDEFLNGERFDTLLEAQVLIEAWRHEYNEVRPHSSLGYHSPAPEVEVGEPLLNRETLTLQVV